MTTGIDITELKRLHEAATKAPWWVERVRADQSDRQPYLIKYRYDDVPTWIAESSQRDNAKADFDFTVALRNSVPAIIAALERLEWIEGALPKTADGVSVVPGSVVWYVRRSSEPQKNVIAGFEMDPGQTSFTPDSSGTVHFSPTGFSRIWNWRQAFSTREAALAAKEGT